LLVEGGGFGLGVDAQFVGEELFADLELGQGSAALSAQREEAHQLALAVLAPGVQLHQPPGVGQAALVIAAALIVGSQALQGLHSAAMEMLAAQRDPLLKGHAIGDG